MLLLFCVALIQAHSSMHEKRCIHGGGGCRITYYYRNGGFSAEFSVTSLHLAVKFSGNRYPDLEETRTNVEKKKEATHKL